MDDDSNPVSTISSNKRVITEEPQQRKKPKIIIEEEDDDSTDSDFDDNSDDDSVDSDSDTESEYDITDPRSDDYDEYIEQIYDNVAEQPWFTALSKENQDDYYELLDELTDEEWFVHLSTADQYQYLQKYASMIIYPEPIPTLRQILDLNLDTETTKELKFELDLVTMADKQSTDYGTACKNLIKHFNMFSTEENRNRHLESKKLEENLRSHSKYTEALKDRILNSHYEPHIKNIIYDKYLQMQQSSNEEGSKYEQWINTVLSIPHTQKALQIREDISVNQATNEIITSMYAKLNASIYGMDSAKEEVMCVVANMISNPKSKYKVIGLCGPPGVGKTMIAQVISEALQLPLEQISLGGMTDTSFLEGHGFTYVGAEPGAVLKAVNRMGCTNGIIFFDEIDKIGQTERGKEIESSLLHITDFTQNHCYQDKYISEIPVDLSNMFFIYSMNSIQNMDGALASRIPIIRFDGYTPKEKINIVQKLLLPRNYEKLRYDSIGYHFRY